MCKQQGESVLSQASVKKGRMGMLGVDSGDRGSFWGKGELVEMETHTPHMKK